MPWTTSDVERFKHGLTPAEKRRWVEIANSTLQRCLARGGNQQRCEASAIRQASGVVGHEENINDMEVLKFVGEANSEYSVRTEQYEGREHVVVPVVMMVEGVHNGSRGPVYHSAEELGHTPGSFNGIPVVVQHPVDEDGGFVSANAPGVLDASMVGRVFNAHFENGKLKGEAWLDTQRMAVVSPLALSYINDQHPLEVSLGLFSDEEETEGEWNKEHYIAIAHNHRPDHLALLPGGVGACSWEDGCGIRVNERFEPPESGNAPQAVKSILSRVYNDCRSRWVRDHPNDRENSANKTSCARIAWSAVENAGWRKQGDRWIKVHQEGGNDVKGDLEVNALRYSGTESTAWSGPTLSDFGVSGNWDSLSAADRSRVASHYLIGSATAASFAELKLPVVNPRTGKLNERALRAVIGGRGAQVGGVSAAQRSAARRRAYQLLNSEFDADLEVPANLEAMKEFSKEGFYVQEIADHVEKGFKELVQNAQTKLDRMDDDMKLHFLQEIYADYMVYEIRRRGGEGGGIELYRRNYTVNDAGEIEFTSDPTRVRREVEYVVQKLVRTKTNNSRKMSNDKKHECETCEELIQALIANERTNFAEEDRDWLVDLSEEQLKKLEPVEEEEPQANKKKEEKKKEEVQANTDGEDSKTKKGGIENLTNDQKAALAYGEKQMKARRAELVQSIQANAKDVWTDEDLNSKDLDELEKISSAVKPVADYSGNLGANAGTVEEHLYPAGVEVETKK